MNNRPKRTETVSQWRLRDVPTALHRAVKSYAAEEGQTQCQVVFKALAVYPPIAAKLRSKA